ncbi:MAG: D-alanine--poly(phosphoribitol) ligase subunit DltA [Deltaproteobacteria bacterium]|nr:D-alanine--poly(phosphoribitol) ligase subunit DltA [Deltaproteobacteria bacterium]
MHLAQWFADYLHQTTGRAVTVDPDTPFTHYGLSSLDQLLCTGALSRALQREIPATLCFTHPTVRAVERFLAESQPEAKGTRAPVTPHLAEDLRANEILCTPGQAQLLFAHDYFPDKATYNVAAAWHCDPAPDRLALQAALDAVARAHPILRASLRREREHPKLVISGKKTIPWMECTVPQLLTTGGHLQRAVRDLCGRERRRPFALNEGPLLRVLIVADSTGALIQLTAHHVVIDYWSLQLLVRAWSSAYATVRSGEIPQLIPRTTFSDIAQHHATHRTEFSSEATTFFEEVLRDHPPQLRLAHPEDPDGTTDTAGETCSHTFNNRHSEALRRFAQAQDATVFECFLAMLTVLFARQSGHSSFLLGLSCAGRVEPSWHDAIGYCVNTLPYRAAHDPDETFHALLRRTGAQLRATLIHQAVSAREIIHALRPNARGAYPLFEVLLNHLAPSSSAQLGASHLRAVPLPEPHAKFPLTVTLAEERDTMTMLWNFQTHRYGRPHIARLMQQTTRLLARLLHAPDAPVRAHWLATRHAPGFARPIPARPRPPLSELLDHALALHGERAAIRHQGTTMTYAALAHAVAARAAQLAPALRAGASVACYGSATLDTIISLLALTKLRATIVPIDAELPPERKRSMLLQSACGLVVAEAPDAWLEEIACPVWIPRAGCDPAPRIALQKATAYATPDDVTFIFFTSGSTGRPKGVIGRARGIRQYVEWFCATYAIGADDRVSGLYHIAFEPFLRDLYIALHAGATLVLHDARASSFVEWLHREAMTLVHTVPSVADHRLAEPSTTTRLPHLRTVVLGGEPLHAALVQRWRMLLPPHATILNIYGPTETTLAKTVYVVPPACRAGIQPIGTPIPDCELYIMDAERCCDVGEIGEIVLRTPWQAQGYLADADTAARFRSNPATGDSADRLYYTGDRGYRRDDGVVEILGRIDDECKIHGIRVQPREIEHYVTRIPDVRTAYVLAQRTDTRTELIAYYVSTRPIPTTVWHAHLRQYTQVMPRHFIHLPRLPTTANGKVDVAALPLPSVATTIAAPSDTVPSGSDGLEEIFLDIVRRLLQQPRLSPANNFYDVGGNSLLATRVIAAVRETLHVELDVCTVVQASTLGAIARQVRQLKEHGAQILLPPIRPHRSPNTPLSYPQWRLWFAQRLEPHSPRYHLFRAYTLEGTVSRAHIERVLRRLTDRHPALRTSFHQSDEDPVQRVHASAPLSLQHWDLAACAASTQAQQIEALVSPWIEQPFDFEHPPLMRAALLKLAPHRWQLVLCIHHIVCDGWSSAILLRDLCAYWRDPGRVDTSSAIAYTDFAQWQRQLMDAGKFAPHARYWSQQLANAPTRLTLPYDAPWPETLSHRGERVELVVSPELVQRLRALAGAQHTTLFVLLLCAFRLLLTRLSGQPDLVIGIPIAGRRMESLEAVVGFFINMLPLRLIVDDAVPFTTMLRAETEAALYAYTYQDYPYAQMVAAARRNLHGRDASLFQVIFNYRNMPQTECALDGVHVREAPDPLTMARDPLGLHISEEDTVLRGTLIYQPELFQRSTIEAMAAQWLVLLEQIVAHADRLVHEYCLGDVAAPAPTRHAPMPQPPRPAAHPLATLAQIARQCPSHPAMTQGDQTMSYAALLDQVERKARSLRRIGVASHTRVAVVGRASIDLCMALLAVMRAGGTAVPIDTTLPYERRQAMIHAAQVTLALLVPSDDDVATVEDLPTKYFYDLPPGSSAALPPLDPGGMPYLFFTSGSSGAPKGILGRWRGLAHVVASTAHALAVTHADRVTQLYPIGFEPLMRELFLALTTGAELLLPPDADTATPRHILQWIARQRATIVQTVPSVAAVWMAEARGLTCPSVRTLLLGGEPLTDTVVRQIRQCFPAEIFNIYGPTETTLHCTMYRVPDPPQPGVQPIGTPLPGVALQILSGNRPCGTNESGEIVIRSPYRSAGYLPETAEQDRARFCVDPLAAHADDLVYRTGDCGRYHADGYLVIAGRLDEEIKIHGVRVHPQEIEQTLLQHPHVQNCAVISGTTPQHGSYLAAYVAGATTLTSAELRTWLRHKLPSALVPQYVLCVAQIPQLPNGKVDKHQLPDPLRSEPMATHTPATTATEQWLVATLESLLERTPIGTNDNFFDVGGHSLQATRLVARMRETFQITFPLQEIFTLHTVGAIAERIDVLRRAPESAVPTHLPAAEHRHRAPLSFAQQRLWILHQLDPTNDGFNLTRRQRLIGPLAPERMGDIFRTIIARHEALRTALCADDNGPYQHVWNEMPFHVVHHDLSPCTERTRQRRLSRLVAAQEQAPFDLSNPPLLRVSLVKMSTTHYVLVITIHHIVCDGWSIRNIVHEVLTLWEADRQGTAPALPPLAVQYPDYALWQRNTLSNAQLQPHLEYWRQHLGDRPSILPLPSDKPWPKILGKSGGRIDFVVPASTLRRLHHVAREHDATLFMLLMSAYRVLLARLTNHRDVIVGTPVAGRQWVELEDAIGFFINMLPIRVELDDTMTFAQLLAKERIATLGAFAHQEVPFDTLVERLQCERHPNRPPLYQTVLNLRNMPRRQFRLHGVRGERVAQEHLFSRDPLLLNLTEVPGGLEGSWIYNTDLFTAERVSVMRDQWLRILAQIVDAPGQPLSAITLDDARSTAVWQQWARPLDATPQQHPLHAVHLQARRHSRKIALQQGHRTMTYRECWRRVECAAAALRTRGVTANTPVGVVGGRSLEMILALLAVMRAGAVPVPLDHQFPRERLALMLREARCTQVLCVATSLTLPESIPFASLLAQPPAAPKRLPAIPDDGAAYIYFTSGSTGTPKGIVGAIPGLAHYHHWLSRQVAITPDARVAQLYTPGFEPFMRETFLALANGARLVIPPAECCGPDTLVAWLETERVTHMHTVPSIGRLLIRDAASGRGLRALRHVIFGGEPLDRSLVVQWRQAFAGQVTNIYGPTETMMAKTYYPVPDEPPPGVQPLGRPIPETVVLVLRDGRPCAIGEIGELVIRTPFRSRGYLPSVPPADHARFRPNPLTNDPSDIVYYTGDTGQIRPDGTLAIHGRVDDEVKIHGVRIHPAEIEHQLAAHPHIRAAAVVVSTTDHGKRLLAFYVAETALTAQTLRDWLARTVLSAALPALYVPVNVIPLTVNGKVDKQQLLAIAATQPDDTATPQPMTATEQMVLTIARDLTERTALQIDDNFFAAGGNSLMAIRLVTKLRAQWPVDISLPSFFAAASLRAFCATLDNAPQPANAASKPASARKTAHQTHPLSCAQERMWRRQHERPEDHAVHIMRVADVHGPFDAARARAVLEFLIARHAVLRTGFIQEAARPRQQVHASAPAHIAIWDLSRIAVTDRAAQIAALLCEEKARQFDVTQPPLFRMGSVRLGRDRRLLYWTLHHLIGDGWSINRLLRDFAKVWNTPQRQWRRCLPPVSMQYPDYVQWEQEQLAHHGSTGLRYWQEHLGDRLPLFGDTADHIHGTRLATHFSSAVVAAVQTTATQLATTPFTVLLTLYRAAICACFQQRDTIIGIQSAGRLHGADDLIGNCINVLPVRGRVDLTASVRSLITREQHATTGAYQHQQVPIQHIAALYAAQIGATGTPYQIHFNYRNMPSARLDLNRCVVRANPYTYAMPVHVGVPLSLNIKEHGGRVSGIVQYDARQFSGDTIQALLATMRRVALALPTRLDAALRELLDNEHRGQQTAKRAIG